MDDRENNREQEQINLPELPELPRSGIRHKNAPKGTGERMGSAEKPTGGKTLGDHADAFRKRNAAPSEETAASGGVSDKSNVPGQDRTDFPDVGAGGRRSGKTVDGETAGANAYGSQTNPAHPGVSVLAPQDSQSASAASAQTVAGAAEKSGASGSAGTAGAGAGAGTATSTAGAAGAAGGASAGVAQSTSVAATGGASAGAVIGVIALVALLLVVAVFITLIFSALPSGLAAVSSENSAILENGRYSNIFEAYSDINEQVYDWMEAKMNEALKKAEDMVNSGGYDEELSTVAAQGAFAGLGTDDLLTLISAFSVYCDQTGTEPTVENLIKKLEDTGDKYFQVITEEGEQVDTTMGTYTQYIYAGQAPQLDSFGGYIYEETLDDDGFPVRRVKMQNVYIEGKTLTAKTEDQFVPSFAPWGGAVMVDLKKTEDLREKAGDEIKVYAESDRWVSETTAADRAASLLIRPDEQTEKTGLVTLYTATGTEAPVPATKNTRRFLQASVTAFDLTAFIEEDLGIPLGAHADETYGLLVDGSMTVGETLETQKTLTLELLSEFPEFEYIETPSGASWAGSFVSIAETDTIPDILMKLAMVRVENTECNYSQGGTRLDMDPSHDTGTVYKEAVVQADTRLFERVEECVITDYAYTRNGYVIYDIPDELQEGYYYVDGIGTFILNRSEKV